MQLYPFSWFTPKEAETDPIHQAVCEAVAMDPHDSELVVYEVDVSECGSKFPAPWEHTHYFQVREAGRCYGPIVAVNVAHDHRYLEAVVCGGRVS